MVLLHFNRNFHGHVWFIKSHKDVSMWHTTLFSVFLREVDDSLHLSFNYTKLLSGNQRNNQVQHPKSQILKWH